MQAGLSRAIPMAILGYMFGALIVIVLRGLQGLTPIYETGPGIIVSAIMTAVFFIWGMGAFDPRLSVHGEEEAEEAVHEELAEEAQQPRKILTGSFWYIVTITLAVMIVLAGFAVLPGGFGLTQTITPGASLTMVGYATIPLPFGGPDIQVSTLVLFALFVLWAFVSLLLAAWVIAWMMSFISRGLTEVQTAGGGTAALPAPVETSAKPQRSWREAIVMFLSVFVSFIVIALVLKLVLGLIFPAMNVPVLAWFMNSADQVSFFAIVGAAIITWLIFGRERFMYVAPFVITFVILYLVFYYVAIGLILPNPSLPVLSLFMDNPTQLVMLSLVNAILFTFIILRPQLVLHTVGYVSRWLAKVLRAVPRFLQ